MSGRVIVAGAGCGDYDLITMRGYEALKSCDVVIYDSLIDSRLLDFCKDGAEKICVGKRAGRHSSTQEEINTLLVEKPQRAVLFSGSRAATLLCSAEGARR